MSTTRKQQSCGTETQSNASNACLYNKHVSKQLQCSALGHLGCLICMTNMYTCMTSVARFLIMGTDLSEANLRGRSLRLRCMVVSRLAGVAISRRMS